MFHSVQANDDDTISDKEHCRDENLQPMVDSFEQEDEHCGQCTTVGIELQNNMKIPKDMVNNTTTLGLSA